MNNDTVVGIVGALALVAVMVGVFVYEYNNEVEGTTDTDDFVATTASGPQAEATTNVGAETPATIELNQTFITNVTFTLTWSHQAAPDTMMFTVTGPNGISAASQQEDDGSISLKVPVPDGATDEDMGAGQWNVTVEFVSAEQTDDGLPGGIDNPATDPESDSSVSWTLATRVEHLAPPADE